jgi:hypothetical protein
MSATPQGRVIVMPGPALAGSRAHLEALPGGGYAYDLIDEGVRIELRYLRRERGQLHGEVDVQCTWAGVANHRGSLTCADQNLSSQPARRTLAKHCADRAKTKPEDFDWLKAIDGACLETIRAERDGEDPIVLDDAADTIEQDHHVHGITIPADSSSMLIAHGDSLKSMLLLFVLGMLALAGMNVLYLDWEWTAARHKGRKRKLFGTDPIPGLFYLRCRSPLAIELDRIRGFAEKKGIVFFGVDSVGLAADGKLSDDDTAIRFHRALNSLPGGKLCAAHVPKATLTPEALRAESAVTPFGSVFFSNLCRMTWAVRKQPGASPDQATVGLFPAKQNDGERVRPVGLVFKFSGEQIKVEPVDLTTVDGLAERLPIRTRIEATLKHGPMTYAALADALNEKVDSVIKAVKRNPERFVVVSNQPDGVQRIALKSMRVA